MAHPIVRYEFENLYNGEIFKAQIDPKGWRNAKPKLVRSMKGHGIISVLSKNLEFTGETKRWLDAAYEARDIEAAIIMREYKMIPYTTSEDEYVSMIGDFDFSEIIKEENYTKIPFTAGRLNAQLNAKWNEKIEIQKLLSLNGITLEELALQDVLLTPRRIFLESAWENAQSTSVWFPQLGPARVPELNVVSNQDEENVSFSLGSGEWSPGVGSAEQFFYTQSDVAKTINVRICLDLHVSGGGFNSVWYQVAVARFSFNGSIYTQEEIIYFYGSASEVQEFTRDLSIDETRSIDLDEDDSLVLIISTIGGNSATTGNSQQHRYNKLKLIATEDSVRQESSTKAVLMHEMIERTVEVITGVKQVYSQFYGRLDIPHISYPIDGEYSGTAWTFGKWVRQFFDDKIQISMKEIMQTAFGLHNVGYTIQTINNSEIFVVESMKYFFQNATVIELGEVSDYKENAAKELFVQSGDFGYKKGGEFEENMGLDEYNIMTSYGFPITRVEGSYDALSDGRGDSYAKEFARRLSILNYPNTDSKYDKDLMILDVLKRLGQSWEERLWGDDYESAPTGIFDPDSATGLRITPARNMERHLWWINAAHVKFPQEWIRHLNSQGNPELVTKKVGEPALSEAQDIQINATEQSRAQFRWATFQHKVDYSIERLLYGHTEVSGRLVPNWFFKVKFLKDGQKKHGWIYEVEPNSEGKWKLLLEA